MLPDHNTPFPANDGNFSWWGAFAKNLFSLKNFTDEFKRGGRVNFLAKGVRTLPIRSLLACRQPVKEQQRFADRVAARTLHSWSFSLLSRNAVFQALHRHARPLVEYERSALVCDLSEEFHLSNAQFWADSDRRDEISGS